METSIYAFEGSYLSDSLFPPSATSNAASTAAAQFGNIIRGYDSYLKAPSAGSGDRNKRGRGPEGVNERERMFSASSATYTKVRFFTILLHCSSRLLTIQPFSNSPSN